MKKFIFFSRHELGPEQRAELERKGFTDFESVNPGVFTSADDVKTLCREHPADGYGLVAPGRIWAQLVTLAAECRPGTQHASVYEAESRQAPELRQGDGPVPFAHIAWHGVTTVTL